MVTKAYKHPLPDFSTALPPKNVVGLDVKPADAFAVLNKRKGTPITATMVLQALGENIDIWDNHAAAICALANLEEHGKIQKTPDVTVGNRGFTAWLVPKPKVVDAPPAAGNLPAAG